MQARLFHAKSQIAGRFKLPERWGIDKDYEDYRFDKPFLVVGISDIRGMQLRDMEAIRAVPGVVSAAWTNQVPLGRSGWNVGGLSTSAEQTNSQVTAAQYFSGESMVETFGLNLVDGRDFLPEEVLESDPQVDRNLPIVFLDTGKHFEETLSYRDALAADFGD